MMYSRVSFARKRIADDGPFLRQGQAGIVESFPRPVSRGFRNAGEGKRQRTGGQCLAEVQASDVEREFPAEQCEKVADMFRRLSECVRAFADGSVASVLEVLCPGVVPRGEGKRRSEKPSAPEMPFFPAPEDVSRSLRPVPEDGADKHAAAVLQFGEPAFYCGEIDVAQFGLQHPVKPYQSGGTGLRRFPSATALSFRNPSV
jgi:hypothetical protein